MSRWTKFWQSARGFSLTEVMVGGAILAGVAVAGARMFKDQRNAQARLEADQSLQQFHQNFAKFIQDEKNCNATFSDWLNRNPAQVLTSATSQFYTCSNCGNTLGFNYDLSSAARGPVFLQVPSWIENVNGTTVNQRGLWRVTNVGWKPGYSQPSGTGTWMLQVTYEMDPAVPGSRAIEKRNVKKDISLNLRFTQNSVATSRLFKECLSPKESAVNNLQTDLCQTMTQVTSTGNIVGWTDASQTCNLQGSSGAPVKTCPAGMVVSGIKSDGTVSCEMLNQGVQPSTDLLDNTACPPGTSIAIESVVVGGVRKMRTRCY